MIQLSIEVADKPGELARIVGLMAREQIDIKALYVGQSRNDSTVGLVKVIVTDSARAHKALRGADLQVSEENVLVTALEDHPGGLHAILEVLAASNLNIVHAYSFVSRIEGKALSVFAFDDNGRARQVLAGAGVHIIDQPAGVDSAAAVPGEPDLSAYVGGVFYW